MIGETLPKEDKYADRIKLYYLKCHAMMENKQQFQTKYDIYDQYKDYNNFKDIFNTENQFKQVLREIQNRKAKRYRTYQKIKYAFIDGMNHDKLVVFGTITFNDNAFYLNGDPKGRPIQETTRTKAVNEWINDVMDYAVVTIDYGDKNGREHHHFAGILSEDYRDKLKPVMKNGKQLRSKSGIPMYELDIDTYKKGWNPDFEIVQRRSDDYLNKRISNYLTKISNHNAKESMKNRRFRVLGKHKTDYLNQVNYSKYLLERYS